MLTKESESSHCCPARSSFGNANSGADAETVGFVHWPEVAIWLKEVKCPLCRLRGQMNYLRFGDNTEIMQNGDGATWAKLFCVSRVLSQQILCSHLAP
jgi:hypothetical protein